ncbi:hypothetical protein QR685DRAFT_513645 [Neurospora intermedia]|uniref:Uncharacterized protein n=1 Tax=Neurospora intermedia TaxID=5142 RepID=A0ABR3DV48_NEUIN
MLPCAHCIVAHITTTHTQAHKHTGTLHYSHPVFCVSAMSCCEVLLLLAQQERGSPNARRKGTSTSDAHPSLPGPGSFYWTFPHSHSSPSSHLVPRLVSSCPQTHPGPIHRRSPTSGQVLALDMTGSALLTRLLQVTFSTRRRPGRQQQHRHHHRRYTVQSTLLVSTYPYRDFKETKRVALPCAGPDNRAKRNQPSPAHRRVV